MIKNNKLLFSLCVIALMSAYALPVYAAETLPDTDKAAPQTNAIKDETVNPNETLPGEITPLAIDEKKVEAPDSGGQGGFAGNYLSALHARSNGNIKDSITNLEEAYRANPQNKSLVVQLQAMMLMDGMLDKAIDLAASSPPKDRDTISLLLLALRDIKQNKPADASKVLDTVADSNTGQLWMPLINAWLDLSQGKLKKPLKVEDVSAGIGRAESLVNYHLALINNQAGFKDAAIENFKNAIEDPQNPPGHIMEAVLAFYTQNGQPEALKKLVSTYLAANSDSMLNSNAVVVSTLQEGVAEVLFTMGSIMLEAEVYQDAAIYLQLAVYLRPNFDVAALMLGSAYSKMQQYDRSNETYAKVAEISRLHMVAQLHIAMNYDRMDKTTEAIAKLDEITKRLPTQYESLVAKGDLLRVRFRYNEAIEAYNQALARINTRKSHHWPILFARGASYERLGKIELAEQDMQEALKLKPDQPDVMNFLGYSWVVRGYKTQEAKAMIEKALKLRPNNGQIADSMGWALYLEGKYEEALKYLEKATELLPSDPTVNDHLGDSYWRMGRKTEARYQWERALSFSPEPAEAQLLQNKLKDGLPEVARSTNPPKIAARETEAVTKQ
ncbi:MAG: tetratricopeptide repeat protein [Rickettsiales bacterium]|nr:tetratricopeptide repeat protein [Rickettsiales bacterium]